MELRGRRGSVAPHPNKNGGGRPYVLAPKDTFKDVFDNTCDIADFTERTFSAQEDSRTTQEAPCDYEY